MEDVREIFVAVLADKESGTLIMRTAKHPYAAAVECFSKVLGTLDPVEWDEQTELITILRVYSMENSIFGFSPELIGLDNHGNPRIPGNSNYEKLGAVLISLTSPKESGQSLGFNIEFLPVAKTINDITAN
jgi:hypothetical protein